MVLYLMLSTRYFLTSFNIKNSFEYKSGFIILAAYANLYSICVKLIFFCISKKILFFWFLFIRLFSTHNFHFLIWGQITVVTCSGVVLMLFYHGSFFTLFNYTCKLFYLKIPLYSLVC